MDNIEPMTHVRHDWIPNDQANYTSEIMKVK